MTREEFVSIPRLASAIALKGEALQEIRSAAYSLPSPQLGYRGHQGTHSDRVGSFAGKITDLEQEILQNALKLAELRLEELRLLRALPYPEQSILQLRYVVGLKWFQISGATDYEGTYCYRLHRKGLSMLPFDEAAPLPGTNTTRSNTHDS